MAIAGRFLVPGAWKCEQITTTDNSTTLNAASIDIADATQWGDNVAAGDGTIYAEAEIHVVDPTSAVTGRLLLANLYYYIGGSLTLMNGTPGGVTPSTLYTNMNSTSISSASVTYNNTGTSIRIGIRGGANHDEKWLVSLRLTHFKP